MKIVFPLMIICILVFASQGCYYDKEDILYPTACDTANVTYSQTVKPVINSYCLSCHGSSVYNSLGGSINLDGYSNLMVQVDNGTLLKAINQAPGASPMPKNQPKLSDCNISKIRIWINSGALNN